MWPPELESTHLLVVLPPSQNLLIVKDAPKHLIAETTHRHQGACDPCDLKGALKWDAAALHVRANLTIIWDPFSISQSVGHALSLQTR